MADSEDDFVTEDKCCSGEEHKKTKPPKKKIKLENKKPKTSTKKKSDSKSDRKSKKVAQPINPPIESPMRIGAHLSIKDGFSGAVIEALNLKANAFAIFTASRLSWTKKPLDPKAALEFKETCVKYKFPPHSIVPHGSYLINLATEDEEKLKKSKGGFLDEMKRCEMLGLVLYNFHPGSATGGDVEAALKQVAECINEAHEETKNVIAVIENTAGQGSSIGHTFDQIKKIIDHVKDKNRVGVCIDTCHLFAAGYDIRTKDTYDKTFKEFESKIGFQYLKAFHLNDSKQGLGCKVDRHENIGKGHIGLEGFRLLMNDTRFHDIPMVLETPENPYDQEIALLRSLMVKQE